MITATKVYFIKLGEEGIWEKECLEQGTLRLGYRGTPHEACVNGDWPAVKQFWTDASSGNVGVGARHAKQIQIFYEATEEDIFITFYGRCLYWCRPGSSLVKLLSDGARQRTTLDGWSNKSIGGTVLSADRLSGKLLKVQMFRGTICKVEQRDYVLRKLSDELSPQVQRAETATENLRDAVVGLMRELSWQDFQLLVELTFSASGWRRIGPLGGSEKTVDFELVLPSTNERGFVQVKSETDQGTFLDYVRQFKEMREFQKMFFVHHSGTVEMQSNVAGVYLVGPERLAEMVLDAGLTTWLCKKV